MEWQTKVEVQLPVERFTYATKFLFLGSCFAEELAAKMRALHFLTAPDAFGPLFNPASIASALERLEGKVLFEVSDVVEFPYGAYGSYNHHTSFSRESPQAFLQHANDCLQKAARYFTDAHVIILTLGTAWVYKHDGKVVANCHKVPMRHFERIFMDPQDIVDKLQPLIQRHKDKKWVLTVSPIRHWADGAHGNQLSKASLLLAVKHLQKTGEHVLYFPSYEIVMDQLRDYRFYASDRFHLTQEAVDYIIQRFFEAVVDNKTMQLLKRVEKLNKSLNHQPFFPDTQVHENFLKKLDKQRDELMETIANTRNL
ncbi:MAG: GSCFA domain-containing protein [Bacteroidales bacterium]